MKIVLELKDKPQKDDILVFNGKEWECRYKDYLLKQVYEQQKEIEELKEAFLQLKLGVNDKLKLYHSIIQQLTKEE